MSPLNVIGDRITTEKVAIKVAADHLLETLLNALFRQAGVNDTTAFLDSEGQLVVEEEEHTSHTYWTKKVLQKSPSPEVVKLVETADWLRKQVRQLP